MQNPQIKGEASGEVEWALQRASLCVKFVVYRTKANAAKRNKDSQVGRSSFRCMLVKR